jgi:hypothetical protein
METNVGGFDGAFRTLLFIVSLVVSILTGQWWWVLVGIIFFATAVFGFCPIYGIVGVNTDKKKTQRH